MSSEVRIERPGTLPINAPKPKPRVTFKNPNFHNSRDKDHAHGLQAFRRIRSESDYRPRRKRTSSCSFSWDRKRHPQIILPTKFLLGGNIADPLNLEALKEEVAKDENTSGNNNRGGGIVRVIIPPNINDPLNLDASSEDGEEQLADAISRQRKRRKNKRRKRRNSEPGGGPPSTQLDEKRLSLPTATEAQLSNPDVSQPEIPSPAAPSVLRQTSCPALPEKNRECHSTSTHCSRNVNKKCRTKQQEDKIVSPVIPQPGVERKKHYTPQQRHPPDKPPHLNQQLAQPPKQFNPKQQAFCYGNYNQYYGYRNPDHAVDPRVKCMKKEWFENKNILDIGCNIGHISLCIARDFEPQKVFGIDIDKKLIKIAQKNVKHYVRDFPNVGGFSKSMKMLYGPLTPPIDKNAKRCFPYNVSFAQANYVLEEDSLLSTVRPEFDVILCLSVTKWVHLNWGDDGLKRFFKRIFNNLRQEGLLILEPQAWPSYTKRRKISAEIFENYKNIRLFPERFGEYLQKEVGFVGEEKIYVHHHFSKGFRRPIFIYKKPVQPSKSPRATSSCLTSCAAQISQQEDQSSEPADTHLEVPSSCTDSTRCSQSTGAKSSHDNSNSLLDEPILGESAATKTDLREGATSESPLEERSFKEKDSEGTASRCNVTSGETSEQGCLEEISTSKRDLEENSPPPSKKSKIV